MALFVLDVGLFLKTTFMLIATSTIVYLTSLTSTIIHVQLIYMYYDDKC